MQEQQLSDQYMFRGTYEPRFYASRNYVPFDELELAPDANETRLMVLEITAITVTPLTLVTLRPLNPLWLQPVIPMQHA